MKDNGSYNPREIYNTDSDIRTVLTQLVDGTYMPGNPEEFREIYSSLLDGTDGRPDMYFILKDFHSYADAQKKVEAAYRNTTGWARSALLNVAKCGKFSSDRTIEEYVRDIWHLTKVTVDMQD